eukprot:TRINITY_DN2287_c0_g3_i2.p1 TRINITY_DN2287_c0_g3~~TRINITY_DN2287_c0_g3_i2.p1  ORF type:complete len:286 (-),score=66.35 TRINITY_DN2287_c0_g3_i2:111-968(-)
MCIRDRNNPPSLRLFSQLSNMFNSTSTNGLNAKRPQKQGTQYSLNLGQNNGPFLPKDVMITNPRSIQLLNTVTEGFRAPAATHLVRANSSSNHRGIGLKEAPEYYDETTKQYTNFDEKYKSSLNAVENLTTGSTYQGDILRALFESLAEYKAMIEDYKRGLKEMNENINQNNMQSIKEIQPMMKEFYGRLKENLSGERNELFKLQREIDQLNREKMQIQQQILFSHKRIAELEKVVGVKIHPDIEIKSNNSIRDLNNGLMKMQIASFNFLSLFFLRFHFSEIVFV